MYGQMRAGAFFIILLFMARMCAAAQTEESQYTFEECAELYSEGKLEQAVPSLLLYKQALEKDVDFNPAAYLSVVEMLDGWYMLSGDYYGSKQLLNNAMSTINHRYDGSDESYAITLFVLRGQVESALRNYDDALHHQYEALSRYERANLKNEELYLRIMGDIAMSFHAKGDYIDAKLFMDEAIEHLENRHGNLYEISDEPYFTFISNYGLISYQCHDFPAAIKSFTYVIEKGRHTTGYSNALSLAVNNLAVIYISQGNYTAAADMLRDFQSHDSNTDYLAAQNLLLCYLFNRDKENAIGALDKMNRLMLDNISHIFSDFTSTERDRYWQGVSREGLFVNNLAAASLDTTAADEMAYDNILMLRNLLLNSDRIISNYVRDSSNSSLRTDYRRLEVLRLQYYARNNDQALKDSLFREVKSLESGIIHLIPNFANLLKNSGKNWKEVQDMLADGEVAIEFSHVLTGQSLNELNTLPPHYCAFLITKDMDAPQHVILAEVDSIESAISPASDSDPLSISMVYSGENMRRVYGMMWHQLEPYLGHTKRIYYSPSSYLSELNFDMMEDDAGNRLGDIYQLVRVSSTADIANVKRRSAEAIQTACLYGGIDYGTSPETMVTESRATGNDSDHPALALRSSWGEIPSSKTEVESILEEMRKHGIKCATLGGTKATEESVKNFSGHSPDILHLATHGFAVYTPAAAEGNKFIRNMSSYNDRESFMLWCGLMLSGANNAWKGRFDLMDTDDGVLTADEISRLDLKGSGLVVLSACETAKGKVDPVDGTLGLQRAFKIAGAGSILMSLWKVEDESTAMLMSRFYKYLLSGDERHTALKKARKDVMEVYPDPYYWAGFILLD